MGFTARVRHRLPSAKLATSPPPLPGNARVSGIRAHGIAVLLWSWIREALNTRDFCALRRVGSDVPRQLGGAPERDAGTKLCRLPALGGTVRR